MHTLPVIKSVIKPRAILQLVKENYGISDATTCVLIKSKNNDVYRINSASRQSIFKIYGRGFRKAMDICWESDLIGHLAANDIAVPQIFMTTGGEPFLTLDAPEGPRFGTLYNELSCDWYNPGAGDTYHALGVFIGTLYNKSDDFSSKHEGRALDLTRLIRQSRALITSLFTEQPSDGQPMLDLLNAAEYRLDRLIQSGLDWGVCHGDLAMHNVRALTDGRVALLDFENAGIGWRAADLCAMRYELRDRLGAWEAFTAGFCERRPLSEAERAAIDWMLIPMCIDSLRWKLKALPDFLHSKDRHVAWVLGGLREWADRHLLAG